MTGIVHHGGASNRKRGNVGNGVEIGGAVGIAYPKALLPGGFETGIVALALGAQRVNTLEAEALAVDGKAVVIGDGFVLGAAAILLAVVPIFVVAWTFAGFGVAEGAAKLLSHTANAGRFLYLLE